MKIGIVGYQGSGKSTLFHWLTGVAPDPALAHTVQAAMAEVPDPRLPQLVEIYQPKKVTLAALQLVDTPGLSRTHEQSAARLAMIRDCNCLLVVVAAYAATDPLGDLNSFEEDLLIADLDILSKRIERLREAVKKPRPDRDQQQAELAGLEPLVAALEDGQMLRDIQLAPDQQRMIRSFQLFSEKPRLVILNAADDQPQGPPDLKIPQQLTVETVPLSLQLELEQMPPEERQAFCDEMGVSTVDRGALLRRIMDSSGQMVFFTGGPKEVRTWMIPQGATAEDAAASIHTDLAKTFVRAETCCCEDLIRLGSEREVKAQSLMRHEHRGYVVQEGDVLHILASG